MDAVTEPSAEPRAPRPATRPRRPARSWSPRSQRLARTHAAVDHGRRHGGDVAGRLAVLLACPADERPGPGAALPGAHHAPVRGGGAADRPADRPAQGRAPLRGDRHPLVARVVALLPHDRPDRRARACVLPARAVRPGVPRRPTRWLAAPWCRRWCAATRSWSRPTPSSSLISGICRASSAWSPPRSCSSCSGPEWALGLAMLHLRRGRGAGRCGSPRVAVAAAPGRGRERHELRGAGDRPGRLGHGPDARVRRLPHPAVAFDFRGGDPAVGVRAWWAAVSVLAAGGRRVAPAAPASPPRRTSSSASLALVVVGGFVSLVLGEVRRRRDAGRLRRLRGRQPGKLAFDSIVQRDAPDANRGRSFARFETRFQVIWVLGAFIPVAVVDVGHGRLRHRDRRRPLRHRLLRHRPVAPGRTAPAPTRPRPPRRRSRSRPASPRCPPRSEAV